MVWRDGSVIEVFQKTISNSNCRRNDSPLWLLSAQTCRQNAHSHKIVINLLKVNSLRERCPRSVFCGIIWNRMILQFQISFTLEQDQPVLISRTNPAKPWAPADSFSYNLTASQCSAFCLLLVNLPGLTNTVCKVTI